MSQALVKENPSRTQATELAEVAVQTRASSLNVALLTGGGDKPYALGIAAALNERAISMDFIGSDELDEPELRRCSHLRFLNLRGDQRVNVPALTKTARILVYYRRLLTYTITARPKIFHILWNNRFQFFDRTLLMLYYKLFGKRIVLTIHNVNIGKRDGNDSWMNRATLGFQYRSADHIFVHTKLMERELLKDFNVDPSKVSVIPFGINSTLPETALTSPEARKKLGIGADEKMLLFFGNIAPYKGLEYLIQALGELRKSGEKYRLIIAGRHKGSEQYWKNIQDLIAQGGVRDWILERTEYIPDQEVEIYFKAADVFVLPYAHIFQSGVLFLGYNFGLPVIATDVGSLKEEIVEGETGFVSRPKDAAHLAETIRAYFKHELYNQLGETRPRIRSFARDRYSWSKVATIIEDVYGRLFANTRQN